MSNSNKLYLMLPALAVPVLASAGAYGSVIATDSQQTSVYTVSSTDLLEGLTPVHTAVYTGSGGFDNSATGGVACLTNGVAPTTSSSTTTPAGDGGEGGYDGGYIDLIYNFAGPVNLGALNLYFAWPGGRQDPPPMTISVDTTATSSTSDPGWTTIITTTEYSAGDSYSKASITDNLGAPIATNIQSLQITFGVVENGWSGLGEIDAIQGTPEPASLGIGAIVCCLGLLRRRAKT